MRKSVLVGGAVVGILGLGGVGWWLHSRGETEVVDNGIVHGPNVNDTCLALPAYVPGAAEPLSPEQKNELTQLVQGLSDPNSGFLNFHNVIHVSSSVPDIKIYGQGYSPEGVGSVLPFTALSGRVRRLLMLAQKDPVSVAGKFEETLRQDLAAWPAAYKEYLDLCRADLLNKRVGPSVHDAIRPRAAAATFVLGEMTHHASLKFLLAVYLKQEQWNEAIPEAEYRYAAQCPVPPPLTLYALHRLISTYPDAGMSPASRRGHETYMKWAKAHVLAPDAYQVTDVPLVLNVYPSNFRDGTPVQKYPAAAYLTHESKEWFKLMRAFVETLPGEMPVL